MSKDVKTTRRAMLAGAAAVPAITIAPTIALAGEPDPIFAAIEKLQRLNAEEDAVSIDIDRAEEVIRRKLPLYPHGYRPSGLIEWRSYSAISGDEIDRAREEFIRDEVADFETIEQEYREKKREYRASLRAGREWDRKHGLASLRARQHRLIRAHFAATEELSKIKPTRLQARPL
jgi:hypothetical protein